MRIVDPEPMDFASAFDPIREMPVLLVLLTDTDPANRIPVSVPVFRPNLGLLNHENTLIFLIFASLLTNLKKCRFLSS